MQGWTTNMDQLMSFVDEVLRMPDEQFISQAGVTRARASRRHGTSSLALPCRIHFSHAATGVAVF